MKKIPLTKGQFAIVDDWWYDYLIQWKWSASWSKNAQSYYAIRMQRLPKRMHISMHRIIAKTPDGMLCDHIHHDTLDNREIELRNVTRSQSQMNRRTQKSNKLGIKGVFQQKGLKGYRAQLNLGGKYMLDKVFPTLEEAKEARIEAESKYYGKFAYQDDVS